MWLLNRIFRSKLTQEEEAYKAKTWQQLEILVASALKGKPDELAKAKAKALKEIDEQIYHARSVGKTPHQMEDERVAEMNRQIENRRQVLQHGYVLSREDFSTFILPILSRFSFCPDPGGQAWNGQPIADLLFQITAKNYHTSKEAQDQLMGLCDITAVTHVAKALRERYETLRKASLTGAKKVRAYCDRHVCEKCRELDGSELEVATLLAEFTSQSIVFPHEIPSDDSACWCNGPTLAV